MALFQFDPASIAARARHAGPANRIPGIGESLYRGILGFSILSVLGFAPWAILERWFPSAREATLYCVSTAVFIAASGPLLHRLIIGPGSLVRFYKLFALAFIAYAVAWIAFWTCLRGEAGVFLGLLAGAAAMGAILGWAFDALRASPAASAAIFVANAAGYYGGEWLHAELGIEHRYLAMTLWGLAYGVGFGAGLGLAFYLCQRQARALLASDIAGNAER